MSRDWTKDDFLSLLVSAKRESEEHLNALGLKEAMSNAVCVGTLGGIVFEIENDCPLYLRSITDGWWFARYTRVEDMNDIMIVKVAMADGEGSVYSVGDEISYTVKGLLEGKGRIFKKDKVELRQNRSGAEFVALLRTLPEAQQRKIEAVVDLFLAERDQ